MDYLGIGQFSYAERLNKLVLMAPIPGGGIPGEINPETVAATFTARAANDRAFFKKEMVATRFREDVQTDAWFELRIDQFLRYGVVTAATLQSRAGKL